MQNKQNTKAKVIVIAIAILLCLALAVGITGAWYQAQRRATGTVKMDKGIVIDYTGFGKEANGIWIRENETTFRLFSDTNVQPGEKISLESAGIKANASSVDFYARVKLSYEFYNGETKVELANPSDLITTSATFFGSDWVDSGAGDGYYYYATGTTLNKFTSSTPATFVDLFDTNARFIIEGAGFTGAENEGEGGGYVVDETTSINKIVVYLTLETLQGDADATAEGWKIVSEVDFSKVDEGKIVKSNTTTEITDKHLNVTINGNTTSLETVKFPYGKEIILEFDSKNVEYVELIYSDNTTEKFYELAASEETLTKYSQIQIKASEDSKVTAYTVGLWDSEYKGFTYSTTAFNNQDGSTYTITNGVTIAKYLGSGTEINIPDAVRVRERDLKVVLTGINANYFGKGNLAVDLIGVSYPCKFSWKYNGNTELIRLFQSLNDVIDFVNNDNEWLLEHEFDEDFENYEFIFEYSALCETSNVFYKEKNIVEINSAAFGNSKVDSIIIGNNVEKIISQAFIYSTVNSIILSDSVKTISAAAFVGCPNLTTTIGSGWVKVSDSSAVDASTLLKDISYGIKRA